MRICFTSDLHGDAALYDRLEDLLRAEAPDLLILGGDLLPDGERTDPQAPQLAWLERGLLPRIRRWRDAGPPLTVACLPGNHEGAGARDALRRHHDAGRLLLLDHEHPQTVGRWTLLGYSDTPATPHWLKDLERLDLPGDPLPPFPGVAWDDGEQTTREVDLERHFRGRPSIAEELSRAPHVPDPWLLVAHAPPFDTKLDRLAKIPEPIGSRAVRRFIEQRQPAIALHGHVHESPQVTGVYAERLGRTLCINPGQDHVRLHAVVFDADDPERTLRHTVYR